MIFFDVDGTLLNDEAAVRAAVAVFHRTFQAEIPEAIEPFQLKWRALLERWFDRYLAGEIGMQDQRRGRVFEIFPGIPMDEADHRFAVFLKAYEARFELYPDTLPALDALAGTPLGVITNGQTIQQKNKLTHCGILDRFRVVVISEDVGAAKPKPGIFHEAARRAGLQAADCTYVGDRLATDALGALAAGWKGIWLNRDPAVPADSRVATIRTLTELRLPFGG